jgi:hypothetical protein
MVLIVGKTTAQQQQAVHTGEVFEIWQHLVMRYDIYELTNIFLNFAHDVDLKALLAYGLNFLENQINKIEAEMNRLGIPLPPRPPKSINTPNNTEILRDELMFRTVYMGIQNFLNEHQRSVLMMTNARLKKIFMGMHKEELMLFTRATAYGNLKGWLRIPPEYKMASS